MSSIKGLQRADSRRKSNLGVSLIDRHRRAKNKPRECIFGFGLFAVSGSTLSAARSSSSSMGPTSGCYEGERGAPPPEISIIEKLSGLVCEIPHDISSQKVAAVSTGSAHFLLLTKAGQIYGRGDNRFGQLGLGTDIEDTFELTSIALPDVSNIGKVDQIQCSGLRSAAITSEGKLLIWGATKHDEELSIVAEPTVVREFLSSSGEIPTAATTAASTVSKDPLFVIQVVLACGHTAVLAMSSRGGHQSHLVYTWGSNYHGQLGHGDRVYRATPTIVSSLSNMGVKYLSSGPTHMAAISNNLRLYMWGTCYDAYNTQVSYMAIPGAGPSVLTPTLMPHLKVVHRVRCGDGYTLAVCGMRACWAWGVNVLGCLGTSFNLSLTKPTRLTTLGGAGIEALAIGRFHAIAQTKADDGTDQYWSWGANYHNLLAQDLDATFNPTPCSVLVPDLTICQVSCGESSIVMVCRNEAEVDPSSVDGALEKGLTLVEFVKTSTGIISPRPASLIGNSMAESFNSNTRSTSRHQFVVTTFPAETYCSFCRTFMWGIVRQGVQCKNCNFISHTKCVAAANVHMPCSGKHQEPSSADVAGMHQVSAFGFSSFGDKAPAASTKATTSSTSQAESASAQHSVLGASMRKRHCLPPPPLPMQPMPTSLPSLPNSSSNLLSASAPPLSMAQQAPPPLVAPVPGATPPPAAVAATTTPTPSLANTPSPLAASTPTSAAALPTPSLANLLIKIGLIDDPEMTRANKAWMSKTISITPAMSVQQAIQVLLQKLALPLSEEARQASKAECANFSLILAREDGSRGQVLLPTEILWQRAQEGRHLFFTSSVEWLRDCLKRKKAARVAVGSVDVELEESDQPGTIGRKMGGWLARKGAKKSSDSSERRQAKNQKNDEHRLQQSQAATTAASDASSSSSSPSPTPVVPAEIEKKKPVREADDAFTIDIDPTQVEVLEFRAHGTAGDVYKGRYLFQDVAIKFLRDPTPELLEDFRQEIVLMRRIKTKQVVYFYGVTSKPKPCLVMEWCAFGSLMDVLRNPNETVGWNEFFSFASQTIQSVYALHVREPPIVHRDLKTLNYLVDRYYCIKLCDFGLARTTQQKGADIRESLAEELVKTRGTYEYLAPEIYHGAVYSPKSDVYSLAIIMWELAYRTLMREWMKPYGDQKRFAISAALYLNIARQGLRPTIPDNCPAPLAEMLKTYWTRDVEARPGINQMMEDLLAIQKIYDANTAEWDSCIVHIEEPNENVEALVVVAESTDGDDQIARAVSRKLISPQPGGEGSSASADNYITSESEASTPGHDLDSMHVDLAAKRDLLLAQYKALMEKHPDHLDLFDSMLRKLAEELENPLARSGSLTDEEVDSESLDVLCHDEETDDGGAAVSSE